MVRIAESTHFVCLNNCDRTFPDRAHIHPCRRTNLFPMKTWWMGHQQTRTQGSTARQKTPMMRSCRSRLGQMLMTRTKMRTGRTCWRTWRGANAEMSLLLRAAAVPLLYYALMSFLYNKMCLSTSSGVASTLRERCSIITMRKKCLLTREAPWYWS